MKIGLIGPPLSGKSTLYQLLTGATQVSAARGGVPQAAARVPDRRLERLSEIFRPRKLTYALLEVADFPPLGHRCEISGEAAARLKTCHALAVVVRGHDSQSVPWPLQPVPPDLAFTDFLSEMLLNDLCQVETLLERSSDKKSGDQTGTLRACQALLEASRPLLSAEWTDDDWRILRNLAFLSIRPILVAVNISERQLLDGDYDNRSALVSLCAAAGYPIIEFCGTVEQEISLVSPEEQHDFLAAYGLKETGVARLAGGAYKLLDVCSFFTVGEDEVRAWTIKSGTVARKAAGKIHSDMERGFIRAEVIGYEEFLALGGSLKRARELGKLRLEGKEYPVQDGDIINFRFNI
jgi:GTP-binding protein YchF